MSKPKRFTKTDLDLVRVLDQAIRLIRFTNLGSLHQLDIRRGEVRTYHGISTSMPVRFVPGYICAGRVGDYTLRATYAPLPENEYARSRMIQCGELRVVILGQGGPAGEFQLEVVWAGSFPKVTLKTWRGGETVTTG